MAKTKVVLSGIYYPMAILRYFENAFNRCDDIELFTVGPDTGNFIPWKGGMYLPQKYAKAPNLEIPNQKNIDIRAVEGRVKDRFGDFDLWIQVDADYHLNGKPSIGKHFYIATDPHCVKYDYQRTQADVFFNMQDYYSQVGDVYLPYAYDPEWHTPPTAEVEKEFDVSLLGLMYDQRVKVFNQLKKLGYECYHDTGPVFSEARNIYHRTRVGFNWSSLKDLNARVFELLAMGVPSVMNRVPDINKFFQHEVNMLMFDTEDEAVNKIVFLLKNPSWASELAQNGLEAVKPHTWDERVNYVLSYL